MNSVGIFAGRGDIILAMGFAMLAGVWIGWKLKSLIVWIKSR